MNARYSILSLLMVGCMCSCTPRSVREAQSVIAQADSLRAEGRAYEDSTQLAQAYQTLTDWQWFYADDFAHACYHYGRLLRAKDNPAAAMECFISATHSRTHDYHILGRVYSNMGSISHLAGEYALSYDMYERSAEMFLQDGDTSLYYYSLNNMAFELAEQGKKEEIISILNTLENINVDNNLPLLLIGTKAVACKKCEQYDSALYYTSQLLAHNYYEPSFLLVRAQSFSFLGEKDSAVYYANEVLKRSKQLSHINNALYILTNDTQTDDVEPIRQTAAERSDAQKLLSIRQGKLSQATQLLEQDLHRKPNLTWLFAIIATSFLIGGTFYWKNRKRKLKMQENIKKIVNQQADSITQTIKQHIDKNDLQRTLHWKNYALMKADANLYMGNIVTKLEGHKLNETEIRFCILTMLDFSQAKIADTIHYSYPSGIKTLKKRISTKLGTTPPNLRDFLYYTAINL